ncbi:exocyst complex component 2 [Clonorchis sinensis]|uniref:Exocyst complex component 2 n=1 Tax=Clonorchis sinensis TaxID=79923 RepID=H2KP67_CLOSI|nr:exocyst complex component 2 [Clonorchis sinensis]
MKAGGPAPHVTGISPNEGTPGTKLTIRGENLGQTANDLTHVFINQIDVGPTAQWFSPSRITAITPLGEGELEIVVVTNNDKFGTASVSYHQSAERSVGPQTSVPYWPLDERRHCPAIYEHGSGGSSGGAPGTAPVSSGDLDPSTGLPMSELTRINIPLSESALRSIYPAPGSVQLTDKDFNPMMFLLKFYKNSNFNDLTVTFNNFRKSMRVEGLDEPVNVIRTNLLLIFRCLEGMDALKNKFLYEKISSSGRQFELPFEASLSESRNLGYELFEGVLKRRDRAEATRNAIGVMQRYQFLFNLPHAIRSNISKGDYSLVLNDYLRAKSLFAFSDVEVLRRVYGDVENVVSNFRILLKNQLTTMPIDCEEAKRKINYLLQLEVTFDPTWLCLLRFKEWLLEQLRLYQHSYRQATGATTADADAGNTKDASAFSLGVQSVASNRTPPMPSVKWLEDTITTDEPPMLVLVKSICQLLTQHVVQFWRLGTVYASGQFKKFNLTDEASAVNDVSADTDPSNPSTPINPKAAWLQINMELIHIMSNTMRDELLKTVGTWNKDVASTEGLSECIQQFRRCCNVLPLAELPAEIGEIFSRLAHDLRRHAVRHIFRRAQTVIESLHLKEAWDTDVSDRDGGITKLPGLYEEAMTEALSRCLEYVKPQSSVEKPLFDSAEFLERFPDWCGDAMVAFLSTLRRLADQIESTIPQLKAEDDMDAWWNTDIMGARQSSQSPIFSQARGLLYVLNNARWVRRYANQRLLTSYKTAGYVSHQRLEGRLNEAWLKGIDELVTRYVALRSSWLCAPIKPFFTELMARSASCTRDNFPVTGVHVTFRTTIGNLSHVYSELVLILGIEGLENKRRDSSTKNGNTGPGEELGVREILTRVVTMLVKRIHVCFAEVKLGSLSYSARLQLVLDFKAVSSLLPNSIFTSETKQRLVDLCRLGANIDLKMEENEFLDNTLQQEKARMRLLIDSFRIFEPATGSVIMIRG